MATELRFRRGTTAENEAFTGAEGELTYDTDLGLLRTHDGVTPGGRLQDGIIETSGNDNEGYWVRSDGWARCWKTASYSDVAINDPIGGINRSEDFVESYPLSFTSVPQVSVTQRGGGSSVGRNGVWLTWSGSTTSWHLRFMRVNPEESFSFTNTITYVAEGYIA